MSELECVPKEGHSNGSTAIPVHCEMGKVALPSPSTARWRIWVGEI